jgi:UDP-N-acetylmuramoyl-L-alanyl-D-glutamate--2,6-diaminopimelate ligase
VVRCSKRARSGIDLGVRTYSSDRTGITAELAAPGGDVQLTSPLIGEHNLENLLVAFGCGLALGLDQDRIVHALSTAQGAPGRLERIEHPDDVLVFVDYAHTPDALARVLATLRKSTTGRLIALFGAGGDRDPGKRPLMGRAAAEIADLTILTSDNPRGEPPEQILEQVEGGVTALGLTKLAAAELRSASRGYLVEADRHSAIRLAIEAARPGDTVLLAGKGHEKVQIVGDRRLPFDDCVEARAAIASSTVAAVSTEGPEGEDT